VQRQQGIRSWNFEGLETDVAEAAGPDARQRLERLRTGPLEEWVDQLTVMLDRYFTGLEAGRPSPET
jgi:hypothetical protein